MPGYRAHAKRAQFQFHSFDRLNDSFLFMFCFFFSVYFRSKVLALYMVGSSGKQAKSNVAYTIHAYTIGVGLLSIRIIVRCCCYCRLRYKYYQSKTKQRFNHKIGSNIMKLAHATFNRNFRQIEISPECITKLFTNACTDSCIKCINNGNRMIVYVHKVRP